MIEENAKGDQPISRIVRAEMVFACLLFLFALVSVMIIGWIADRKALEDQLNEQRRMAQEAKELERESEKNRKPTKTPEQRLAEESWRLAYERVHDQIGGKDLFNFPIWRDSVKVEYYGFGDFNANFEEGTKPISNLEQRVNDATAKRKVLNEKYTQAKQSLEKISRKSVAKDEFETAEQHKSRMRSKEREEKQLQEKCDSVLDEIVAFEKTCNIDLLRSTLNGLYVLDEALIFVPYTDWNYDAENSWFNVNARFIKDPESAKWSHLYGGEGDSKTTFQAFHFHLKETRASQFVQGSMVRCQYKMAQGGWSHPREFKKYKQDHPFLLIRLGKCSMKVQGTAERILTMPFRCRTEEEKKRRAEIHHRDYGFLGTASVHNQYFYETITCSRWSDEFRPIFRNIENEAQERSLSIFAAEAETSTAVDPLSILEVFADYKTAQGRAQIESALKHFEKIGGVYYKEFCQAVRLQLSTDAM